MIRRIAGLITLALLASVAQAEVATGIGHTMKKEGQKPGDHQMYQPPAKPTAQGEVLEAVSGAGYTYLRVSVNGGEQWIAGTQVSAKKGDKVSYDENVVMHNFYSKTLKRNFDQITFASHVKVVGN